MRQIYSCFIDLNFLLPWLQAGWKENHATFMCELKNLQASGLTTMGHALRTAFDLLNLNRLVSGIDNYGQVTNFVHVSSGAASTVAVTAIHCFKGWLLVWVLMGSQNFNSPVFKK